MILVGNSIESCLDVWAPQQWFWGHPWHDEAQSYLGCFANARRSRPLSDMVCSSLIIIKIKVPYDLAFVVFYLKTIEDSSG